VLKPLPQQRPRQRASQLNARTMARTLRATPSGLRITIRLLSGAFAPAITRLKLTVVHASKLACPPAAYPQPR